MGQLIIERTKSERAGRLNACLVIKQSRVNRGLTKKVFVAII